MEEKYRKKWFFLKDLNRNEFFIILIVFPLFSVPKSPFLSQFPMLLSLVESGARFTPEDENLKAFYSLEITKSHSLLN